MRLNFTRDSALCGELNNYDCCAILSQLTNTHNGTPRQQSAGDVIQGNAYFLIDLLNITFLSEIVCPYYESIGLIESEYVKKQPVDKHIDDSNWYSDFDKFPKGNGLACFPFGILDNNYVARRTEN